MNRQSEQSNVDIREALCNEQAIGPASQIQTPAERTTKLHGLVLDLDPKLYAPGNPLFPPAEDPKVFFQNILPVLERHPLARAAEARMTGTGLHLVVHMSPAVELKSADDQEHWGAIVRAVQCSLPVDPHAPGITALTRPVGSVNGKNGAVVEMLKAGEPVSPADVEGFVRRMLEAPFRTVAVPLLGDCRISPCPICNGRDTRLDVIDYVGRCYNGCGKVTIEMLYNRIFRDDEGRAGREAGEKSRTTRGRRARKAAAA